MNSKLVIAGAAVLALGLVVLAARHWHETIISNLPPVIEAASQWDAWLQVNDFAVANGAFVRPVAGTGSMAPYLPEAEVLPGVDVRTVLVAYIAVSPRPFASIRAGDLCLYRAAWTGGLPVVHVAAQRDDAGWIMVGTANDRFESDARMDESNYDGVVVRTFTWPR